MLAAALLLLLPGLLPTTAPLAQISRLARLEIATELDLGRYERAEAHAAALVASIASMYGPESFESALAGDLLIESRVLNGHGATTDTRNLAERILGRKESWLTASHPALIPSLRNLGAVLISSGDFARAVPYYERALAQSETLERTNPWQLAESLSDLGYALTLAGDYERAEPILNRALDLLEHARTSVALSLVSTLERKGSLLLEQGSYGAARPVLERALAIALKVAPNHPKTAKLLDAFGNLCWFEGNPGESERYYRSALELAGQALRPEHPAVALYMRDLALPRRNAGYVAEARALQERALEIGRKTLAPGHIEFAWELTDLAITRASQGDYAEARRLYGQALDIVVRQYGPAHLHVAALANNLAVLYAELGDFDRARDQVNRAVDIWQRTLGPQHPYVGFALDSLAEVFSDQGRFSEARLLYERALDVRVHALPPGHRDVAQTLTSLAETLGHLGDTSRAMEYSRRALQSWHQATPPNDPFYAHALSVHAELSLLVGDPRAIDGFKEAIARLEAIVGKSHPQVAAARAGLAAALTQQGRYSEGLIEALRAEDIGREHVRVTTRYLAEQQALFFAARRPLALDIALDALRRGRASPLDCARVLDAVIRSRSLVLDELATRQRTAIEARTPSLDAAKKTLVDARQRLANLVVQGPAASRPELYLPLFAQAQQDKEEAERTLAEQSAQFRSELLQARMGLEAVRGALPARTALVSFVRYVDRTTGDPSEPSRDTHGSYAVFVLRSGESRVSFVPLGSAASVEGVVARWRKAVAVPPRAPAPPFPRALDRRLGVELRQRIWDPISSRLQGMANVFIVPDGPLNLVSFASLPLSNGEFLVEHGPTIHYLSAERDVIVARDRGPGSGGLLAIGGPAFDEPVPARWSAGDCEGLNGLTFGSLPAAQQEVDEIASIWTSAPTGASVVSGAESMAPRSRVLAGADATEAAVKRLAPGRRVLHFATHGFFLGADCRPSANGTRGVGGLSLSGKSTGASLQNPLLRSGLALAGANRRRTQSGEHEDGILTAEEVAGLDLDGLEWAVLSACDTGIGEVRAGEGVIGLRRSFQIAGAHTVIMSLWAVDDDAARQWMRALYDARVRRQRNTMDAARDASLTVLRDRRRQRLSTHPFYWAGFVAAGDWR